MHRGARSVPFAVWRWAVSSLGCPSFIAMADHLPGILWIGNSKEERRSDSAADGQEVVEGSREGSKYQNEEQETGSRDASRDLFFILPFSRVAL